MATRSFDLSGAGFDDEPAAPPAREEREEQRREAKPAPRQQRRASSGREYLLDRSTITESLPLLRAIGAGSGFTNSILTTIGVCVYIAYRAFENPATTTREANLLLAGAIGLLLGLGLSLGQVATRGRSRWWYTFFLGVDAVMTAGPWTVLFAQLFGWLLHPTLPLQTAYLGWGAHLDKESAWISSGGALATIVLVTAAGVLSIISARKPEELLFGK